MSDEIEARSTPPQQSAPAVKPSRFGRAFASRNTFARGALLLGSLVVFTLLYAILLQWLSSGDSQAPGPRPPKDASLANKTHAATAPLDQPVALGVKAPVAGRPAFTFRAVDDAVTAATPGFTYVGKWQHITHLFDGRSAGTSSRAYRIGASAGFAFTGRRLRIYGIMGRNGGYAELRIDGETYALLRFYAVHKRTGVLVYESPTLPAGAHQVAIIVAEAPDGLPKRRYVNLDGVAYAP